MRCEKRFTQKTLFGRIKTMFRRSKPFQRDPNMEDLAEKIACLVFKKMEVYKEQLEEANTFFANLEDYLEKLVKATKCLNYTRENMENTTEKLDLTMENMENTIEKLLSYCEKLMKETKETKTDRKNFMKATQKFTSFHVDRKHSSDKMEHILQGLEHSDLLNEKTSTDSKWDSETKWEHKSLESSSTSAYSLKTNNDSDYDYSTSAMTPRTDSGEKGNPSDDTKQTLNPEIKQEHESPEPCVTLLHTLERIINSTLANKCSPVSAQPSPSLKKKHFLDEIQQIQVMDASGLQMDIVYEQNPETECKCESPEPCMSSALSPRSDTQSISQDIQLKHEDLRFVKNLAKGKFQQIFLAEFKGTSQRFAIKASEKHKKDQSKLDKLVLEKQIWEDTSSVKHPFLINLFTCFETQDHIYFVMEYAANGNLWQQLQSGPFSEHKAIFYAACVVLGIRCLHKMKIVHRNITLTNLLLDTEGYVKIADFSLSKKEMGFNDRTSTLCGTPAYTAPEVTGGSYGTAVDWWSLGIVTYAMLVGDLLNRTPEKRLGATKRGYNTLRKHSFFREIDWKALLERKSKPPFAPRIITVEDTNHDGEVTSTQTPVSRPSESENQTVTPSESKDLSDKKQ